MLRGSDFHTETVVERLWPGGGCEFGDGCHLGLWPGQAPWVFLPPRLVPSLTNSRRVSPMPSTQELNIVLALKERCLGESCCQSPGPES